MRKVLIFYASYGGGHLSAAKSIKECISSTYKDVDAELIDCMKYINKGIEKVSTAAYKEMARNAPWAWGKVYNKSQKGPLAQISTSSNKLMSIKLYKLISEKQPDLIISTHPFSNQMCSYLKKKAKITSKIATVLTDYAPHDQWLVGNEYVDYFFVAHEGMKIALHEKGIPNEKIYCTGIPLSNKFLIHYDKGELLRKFGLSANKKTVLFFGGGEFGLGKSRTLDILSSFVNDFNDIQIVAISGKNMKMKRKFENIVKDSKTSNNVTILEYSNEIPELMSISDLVVTKPGGLTTTESIASGVPIVVINPIPGQEEENAKYLESKGIGIWFKKDMDIKETLQNIFMDSNKMREMKIRARILSKRYSTKDICRILLG